MGLAVGTGPFASGKDAPVWGFHADNGTAESAASGRYSGKIQLKAMLGRRVEMRAEPSRLPTPRRRPSGGQSDTCVCR